MLMSSVEMHFYATCRYHIQQNQCCPRLQNSHHSQPVFVLGWVLVPLHSLLTGFSSTSANGILPLAVLSGSPAVSSGFGAVCPAGPGTHSSIPSALPGLGEQSTPGPAQTGSTRGAARRSREGKSRARALICTCTYIPGLTD